MPRVARSKSASGIYHVILRGTNKQEIFHDEGDCVHFLNSVLKYKVQTEMKVFAWCLMGNHVHLLLKEGKEDISLTMKRIGVSYVRYYNSKYDTIGSLFQGRFKSENVETIRYLLTVTRYIHQNPVKAGIVEHPQEWKWSSCLGYYGHRVYPPKLLDSEYVLSRFAKDEQPAREQFKTFNEGINDDHCLENHYLKKISDADARVKMKVVLGEIHIPRVKSLPKAERTKLLRKLKGIEGISHRQIARILGVPPTLVHRA